MRSLTTAMLTLTIVWLTASTCLAQKQPYHTAEEPLPPIEAAQTMRVPEGFRVTLFAGEPDVMQPIAFCVDDT